MQKKQTENALQSQRMIAKAWVIRGFRAGLDEIIGIAKQARGHTE